MEIPANCRDKIELSSFLRDEIEKNWNKKSYIFYNKRIEPSISVKELLDKVVNIKIPMKQFKNTTKISFLALLHPEQTKKLEDLDQKIKIELIDDMLQKVNKSTLNVRTNEIMIPSTHYLNYMGVLIKIHLFLDERDSKTKDTLIEDMTPRINRMKKLGMNNYIELLQKSIDRMVNKVL